VAIGFLLSPLSPAVQITLVTITEDDRVVKRYEAEFAIRFGGACCSYSLGCLEGVFSETRIPEYGVLGN